MSKKPRMFNFGAPDETGAVLCLDDVKKFSIQVGRDVNQAVVFLKMQKGQDERFYMPRAKTNLFLREWYLHMNRDLGHTLVCQMWLAPSGQQFIFNELDTIWTEDNVVGDGTDIHVETDDNGDRNRYEHLTFTVGEHLTKEEAEQVLEWWDQYVTPLEEALQEGSPDPTYNPRDLPALTDLLSDLVQRLMEQSCSIDQLVKVLTPQEHKPFEFDIPHQDKIADRSLTPTERSCFIAGVAYTIAQWREDNDTDCIDVVLQDLGVPLVQCTSCEFLVPLERAVRRHGSWHCLDACAK